MAWEQREVELERQLDTYDRQQKDIIRTAQKVPDFVLISPITRQVSLFHPAVVWGWGWGSPPACAKQPFLFPSLQFDEATGSVSDPSLPLAHQLEQALRKIREHIRTILEVQATCKSLEEVIGLFS